MAKRDLEKARHLARVLYMNGEQGKDIADKVGVSTVTISRWIAKYKWKEVRAAKSVTRPELVNKILGQIDAILDNAAMSGKPEDTVGLADRLSKLASIVEKLDKKANVVDSVEVFMAFNDWLENRSSLDKDLTTALRQSINKYQDMYVTDQMSLGR